MKKQVYKLTLTDPQGVVLATFDVALGHNGADGEASDITKPTGVSSLADDIRHEIYINEN